MNATERAALVRSVQLYDEVTAAVDDRTLDILDRRRRTATVHRRGWLVRRMLLLADVVGLLAAFLFAEWTFGMGSAAADHVDRRAEFLIFALSLPAWIVVTKFYGLYDHDEERTDHPVIITRSGAKGNGSAAGDQGQLSQNAIFSFTCLIRTGC